MVTFSCGQPPSDSSAAEKAGSIPAIDSLVHPKVEHDKIPGAVVRVQQGDSILHQKAYGFAQEYRYGLERMESPDTMTTDHLFDLASLTKVFATTYGIMLLVDQGAIKLDQPIRNWLPEFGSGEKRKIAF